MNDPAHPIWSAVRVGVALLGVSFLLWLNASNFDSTEIRTIVWMIPVLAGAEGLGQIAKMIRK